MNIWRDFHPSSERVLSYIALIGVIALAFVLVAFEPHGTSRDLLLILIGVMAAAVNNNGGAKTTTQTEGDPPVKTTTES